MNQLPLPNIILGYKPRDGYSNPFQHLAKFEFIVKRLGSWILFLIFVYWSTQSYLKYLGGHYVF